MTADLPRALRLLTLTVVAAAIRPLLSAVFGLAVGAGAAGSGVLLPGRLIGRVHRGVAALGIDTIALSLFGDGGVR